MIYILLIICFISFISIPTYLILKLIQCFSSGKLKVFLSKNYTLNNKAIDSIYSIIVFCICAFGLMFVSFSEKTGIPLKTYSIGSSSENAYTSLSHSHLLTLLVFFSLGVLSFYILKYKSTKLAPIPYVIFSSILIINIIYSIVYFLHTYGVKINSMDFTFEFVWILRSGYIFLLILYIISLKNSLDSFLNTEKNHNKIYKNNVFNKLYVLIIKYNSLPILWIIALFPVLIIIQLILILFGQQPDSFIKVFFDTSSYNYSHVIPPDPIIIPGDGHYLCTVSAHGHKKIVKPLRSGIRNNNRILVNRQLLISNAFENILEEYTPKLHKLIRYIYDKYGYPLSKHINTEYVADIIYILMKPLELLFLAVLYSVDKNPENRINIQYTHLRK